MLSTLAAILLLGTVSGAHPTAVVAYDGHTQAVQVGDVVDGHRVTGILTNSISFDDSTTAVAVPQTVHVSDPAQRQGYFVKTTNLCGVGNPGFAFTGDSAGTMQLGYYLPVATKNKAEGTVQDSEFFVGASARFSANGDGQISYTITCSSLKGWTKSSLPIIAQHQVAGSVQFAPNQRYETSEGSFSVSMP